MSLSLKDKLYALRTGTGESQEDIARAINISRVAYTRYENGSRKPGVQISIRLAHHFGIPVEDLMDDETDIKKREKPIAESDGPRDKVLKLLDGLDPDEVHLLSEIASWLKSHRKE